jgi:hypothetical protein
MIRSRVRVEDPGAYQPEDLLLAGLSQLRKDGARPLLPLAIPKSCASDCDSGHPLRHRPV